MADLTITLGGIAFQDFEVPEEISGLGGDQMLAVQKLVGGERVVDAMGRDDAPLSWSGRFRGQDAVSRARAFDAMRIAGRAVDLTFGDFAFSVVVERFTYSFQRFYEISYSLSLVVLANYSDADDASVPGVDEMMASDNSRAQSLGASIGDPTLTGLLSNVSTAVAGVRNFAAATGVELQGVLGPIAAAQGRVTSLIAEAENTLNSVTSLGGVVPGLPAPTLAANLLGQVAAMTRVANLYDLRNVL